MEKQRFFEMLLESLELLAADFETQVSILPSFVDVPDEVALTFGESFRLADQVQAVGLISDVQMGQLKKLHDELQEMIKNEDYWTLDALKDSPQWKKIRLTAEEILASFGREKRGPSLSWITYVPGGPPQESDM